MAKSYEDYNSESSKCEDDTVLGLDTMVQFFISPEKTTDTTDESMRSEIDQFKLSDPKKLADYNLFKSKLFDFDEKFDKDVSKVRMKLKQKQTLFRFEKIVDSKIENSFMPFVSY